MLTDQNLDQDFSPAPLVAEEMSATSGETMDINKPILKKLPPKIIFIFMATVILITILLLFSLSLGQKTVRPRPTPTFTLFTPQPMPLETPVSTSSGYGSDAAILKIEEDLKAINNDLLSTDLKEADLNPPLLDWNIDFKQ